MILLCMDIQVLFVIQIYDFWMKFCFFVSRLCHLFLSYSPAIFIEFMDENVLSLVQLIEGTSWRSFFANCFRIENFFLQSRTIGKRCGEIGWSKNRMIIFIVGFWSVIIVLEWMNMHFKNFSKSHTKESTTSLGRIP